MPAIALYPGSDALATEILGHAPDYLRGMPDGLPAAIGLIALARTSVLPDSGLMHFAAASPGGVVGLFADGGTLSSPARWGPRGPRAVALAAPQAVGDLDDDTVLRRALALAAGLDEINGGEHAADQQPFQHVVGEPAAFLDALAEQAHVVDVAEDPVDETHLVAGDVLGLARADDGVPERAIEPGDRSRRERPLDVAEQDEARDVGARSPRSG